jgi:hypothetical protein
MQAEGMARRVRGVLVARFQFKISCNFPRTGPVFMDNRRGSPIPIINDRPERDVMKLNKKQLSGIIGGLLTLLILMPAVGRTAVLIDCADESQVLDYIDRGFYISYYPGNTLAQVDLLFSSRTAGDYTIILTARLGTYDGPVLGSSEITLVLSADQDELFAGHFIFPDSPITPGSLVTFSLSLDGAPSIPFYNVSTHAAICPVVETQNTMPPLSEFRRDGVNIRVYGDETVSSEVVDWGTVKRGYR